MLELKPIEYSSLKDDLQHEVDEVYGLDTNNKRIYCKVCSTVEIPFIVKSRVTNGDYNNFFSVAEQKHLASRRHAASISLRKLAGT